MTDCDKCKEYDKEKNYCPVFCNVINDALTDKVIEELEKIKIKLFNSAYHSHISGKKQIYVIWETVEAILDEDISELKGENKQ